jgi:hypothetical protein
MIAASYSSQAGPGLVMKSLPFPLLQQPQCGSDKLACAAVTAGDMARGRRRGVSSDAPRNSLPASLSNVTEPLRGFAMSAPVPLRSDFDAALLRKLARGSRDPDQTRRLVALAEIYESGLRSDAARIGGVGLQIVRDWVLRCNAEGPMVS